MPERGEKAQPKDNGPAPLGWRCTSCLTGLGGHEIALGSLCTECRLAAPTARDELVSPARYAAHLREAVRG